MPSLMASLADDAERRSLDQASAWDRLLSEAARRDLEQVAALAEGRADGVRRARASLALVVLGLLLQGAGSLVGLWA